MSKRRRRRKKRGRESVPGPQGLGGTATTAPETTSQGTDSTRARLVGWRQRVRGLLDGVRAYARSERGEAVDTLLAQAGGDPADPGYALGASVVLHAVISFPSWPNSR